MEQSGGINKLQSAYFCSKCGNLYDITNEPPELSLSSTQSSETKVKTSASDAKIHFVCTICGNYTQIKPRTLVFSKKSEDITKEYFGDYIKPENLIHVPTLPHTRDYICPNKLCKTHTDPEIRDAVMNRIGNSYKIMYVCVLCLTMWK